MALFRILDIVERVQATRPTANVELIHKAYVFTAKAHHGQLRISGEPYLIHPLNVAYFLADWNLDEETVATGLLHDTVEDTVAKIEEVRDLFGDSIALLVDGVTKISRVTISDVAAQKAESLRKMILAMGKDLRVILVKLADRLHNLRTIEHLPLDKQALIARETVEIYAPIASRLGMSCVRVELEDRCFAILHPARFAELSQKAEERRRNTAGHIRNVVALLEEKCREAGIVATISGREKHIAGIYQKMTRQGIDFENLHDFIGFRIITRSLRECYGALGIVHNLWKPVSGRFKDYIAMPKPNLYQSLHTSVFGPNSEMMEIQIRTEEMHALADEGVAAHWKYKEGGRRIAEKEDHMFLWLRQILELQQDMKDPREFVDTVKEELFHEEVFVFTPRGDVKELPRGGTPIDFAYAIHTDVGHKCVGAKVNGKLVSLRTELKNGDVVEIITQPSHKPSRDWLKIAKTNKALTRIRGVLRQEQMEQSLDLGRHIMEKELRKYSLNPLKVMKGEPFAQILQETRFKSSDEYLRALGYGRVSIMPLLRLIIPQDRLQEKGKESGLSSIIRSAAAKPSAITVKGMNGIFVRLGNCCHPVPGDPIIGFITRGRGVTVHAKDCRKVLELDPARAIEVTWEEGTKAVHPVKIRVMCNDKPGLLADISKTITQSEVDIRKASVMTTRDKRAVCNFEVSISDAAHLELLIKSIEKVKGVQTVERGRS
ncbi:MAG: bifunctional (p)ppGpp synthetase/guanosine-3',5'-bis(diphosphate) 3'-pyrophosphohydrolase [Syntrophorhabdaceae bacterium]|nr:bifunctional (p)ppGpp synthetase/guanosine-3',5'-bis(diphosphate) 3'-pyrophosphohydrolase [Syntrophorhabdaceae bacterium]